MAKPVEIEILGHKNKIKWIKGHPANPPLHPKDTLSAFIEPVDHVNGTSGFFADIPAKEYGKEELKETIRMYAESALQVIQERNRQQREEHDRKKAREKELDQLGDRLFDMLSK